VNGGVEPRLSKAHRIHAFARIIQPKLAVEALAALTQGPRRWTDLVHVLTVASGKAIHNRTLSETLHRLQDNGIIEHQTADDGGAVYRLTREGYELVEVLDEIASWAERHLDSLGS
jgi:DNA-binding HxlR family transcriptional regulator